MYYSNLTINDIIRYVVYSDGTNKGTKMIEVVGKKKALKKLGLPTDLTRAQPNESRWGEVVSLEEGKSILESKLKQ